MDWQSLIAPLSVIIGVLTIVGFIAKSQRILKSEIRYELEQQDRLRTAELDPIKKQVDNHIPTAITELRTDIKDIHIANNDIRTDIKDIHIANNDIRTDIKDIRKEHKDDYQKLYDLISDYINRDKK